jgi:ubiquinone/menaquinone biosynthesis C-methylase UbiE
MVNDRVDFSPNAKVYDNRHGVVVGNDVVQRVAAAAATVLDVGAGTSRVSITFAKYGCEVNALEPAGGMVEQLRTKARDITMRIVTGDGTALPFPDSCFDTVVVARLLYLVADWRGLPRETRRVLVNGGALLHEWANGGDDEEWVQIRERARALFGEAGVAIAFHPGMRSEREVDAEPPRGRLCAVCS